MTRVALLDVNVLVALFDPDHVQHEAAHEWFARHKGGRLATFDRGIPVAAVAGADRGHLDLIPA